NNFGSLLTRSSNSNLPADLSFHFTPMRWSAGDRIASHATCFFLLQPAGQPTNTYIIDSIATTDRIRLYVAVRMVRRPGSNAVAVMPG
ncbi:hypothetical protein PQ358_006421, partial [Pseudomonas aeruginosa]